VETVAAEVDPLAGDLDARRQPAEAVRPVDRDDATSGADRGQGGHQAGRSATQHCHVERFHRDDDAWWRRV
jgi:hypothetical protein